MSTGNDSKDFQQKSKQSLQWLSHPSSPPTPPQKPSGGENWYIWAVVTFGIVTGGVVSVAWIEPSGGFRLRLERDRIQIDVGPSHGPAIEKPDDDETKAS